MADKDILSRLEESIRHHEIKFWQVFSLMIAANGIFLAAFAQAAQGDYFRTIISFAGIMFTLITWFFVNDLRRYWNAYRGVYEEKTKQKENDIYSSASKKLCITKPCIRQHTAVTLMLVLLLIIWVLFFIYSFLHFLPTLMAKFS